MTIRKIPLSLIRADESAQPRALMSEGTINEYAEDMKRGDAFPPLVVFCENSKKSKDNIYWLGEGFHRYQAKVGLGVKDVQCDVQPGGLREAILYSCGTNATHGLRRSSEDKRAAIAKLIQDMRWSKWSDREIARRCRVDHHAVAKLRAELSPPLSLGNLPSEERTYKTKHGTTATMRTGKIGKSPRPIPERSPEVRATAREMAKVVSDSYAEAFEARRARDSSTPPPVPVVSATPALAEGNESDRHEELFGRLHDLAEELDTDQSQRLRGLLNELDAKLAALSSFARVTIELSRTRIFEFDETNLSGGDKELIGKWELARRRVEPLVVMATAVTSGTAVPEVNADVHAPADEPEISGDATPTEPAGAFSIASPAQDAPGDDIDFPESLRRADRGLQPIGNVIGQIIKGATSS